MPKLPVGGARRQRMVDFLATRPDGATVWEVLGAVYADDPDGGPEDSNVISVMAAQINRKLAPLGYRVRGSGGPGSRYFLINSNKNTTLPKQTETKI